jgi:hypothetical protein
LFRGQKKLACLVGISRNAYKVYMETLKKGVIAHNLGGGK